MSKRKRKGPRPNQPKQASAASVFAGPEQILAAKRMLLEDSLLMIFSELLGDPVVVERMHALAVHERTTTLLRWIFHERANARGVEQQVREDLKQLPLRLRPHPFCPTPAADREEA